MSKHHIIRAYIGSNYDRVFIESDDANSAMAKFAEHYPLARDPEIVGATDYVPAAAIDGKQWTIRPSGHLTCDGKSVYTLMGVPLVRQDTNAEDFARYVRDLIRSGDIAQPALS